VLNFRNLRNPFFSIKNRASKGPIVQKSIAGDHIKIFDSHSSQITREKENEIRRSKFFMKNINKNFKGQA